ncbi:MAG: imelysin family protein [Pseudomonadota bacterium]
MRKHMIVAFLIAFFCGPVVAQPADPIVIEVMQKAVSQFVRPGYETFHNSTKELIRDTKDLCEAPSVESLNRAKETFTGTAKAWAGIELIRFGPVSENNRFERILFYPDRKSTGLKQVQRILAKQDESAVALSRLTGKSVAVQGLGALEFLLFGTGSEGLASGDEFRCAYAYTVSQNLAGIAALLSQGWRQDASATEIWTSPGPQNAILRTPREAVNELLGTTVHALESIRDIRIGAFLRSEASKDRPRVAIFRRSENTMNMIHNNIVAVKNLLLVSGAENLLEQADKPILDNVIFELENAERAAKTISEPIGEAILQPEQRDRLSYLRVSIGFAIQTLDQDFASAAGLSSGFSFSDGD